MGAIEGSISYRTFFVDGALPDGFRQHYMERIRHLAFEPLGAESEEERRMGWVNIQHPLDAAFSAQIDVFYNEYLCLGLRIDRWSIPSPLLKAHLTEATQAHLSETGKERLGRRERQQLKQHVTAQLKQRLLPSMKLVDVVWNLDQRLVRFWSHSKSLGEEFIALFEETFGQRLVADSPYTAAMDAGLDDALLDRLGRLEPEPLGFITPAAEG